MQSAICEPRPGDILEGPTDEVEVGQALTDFIHLVGTYMRVCLIARAGRCTTKQSAYFQSSTDASQTPLPYRCEGTPTAEEVTPLFVLMFLLMMVKLG